MNRRSRRGEDGQTALLIVGFAVVVILLVAVVVNASAAYLQRQALDNLADGAALAAADGVQGAQVYDGGLGERAVVDPDAARRYVADYLAVTGADVRGLRYDVAAAGDGIRVRLSAPLALPLGVPGVPTTVRISSTASSVVTVTP